MAKEKRKLTTFEQIGLLVAPVVIVMYFYVQYVYGPANDRVEELAGRVVSLELSIAALEANPPDRNIGDRLRKVEKEEKEANEKLQKARAKLATKADVPSVINEITSNARRSGLERNLDIRRLEGTYRPAKPKEGAPEILYAGRTYHSVRVVGPFENILAFLFGLGKGSKIIGVEDATIRIINEDGDLEVTLVLRI